MSAVHSFRPDLAPAQVEGNRRCDVITGMVQGTDHYSSIFSDGSFVQVPFENIKNIAWRHKINLLLFSKHHKEKCVSLAKNYMKIDFSTIIFSDECRAALEELVGWPKVWVQPIRFGRQLWGGTILFCVSVVGSKIIGYFKIEAGIKIKTIQLFLELSG